MGKKQYIIFLITCFWVCFLICAPQIIYASPKKVRVGVWDDNPMIFMDKTGPAGLFVDVLENIAKKENWKLSYEYGRWSDIYNKLLNKRIDILPVVAFKESRKKKIDYTAETILSNFGQVYTRKGLEIHSIQDLYGKTIATQPNDIHGMNFKDLLNNLEIRYKNQDIENYIDILNALESKKCDAGVVNHINARANAINFEINSTPIVFSPVQLRYAVPKGDPAGLLPALDKHIKLLKADKNSIYHQSLGKWFGTNSTRYEFPEWIKWVFISVLSGSALLLTGNLFLRVQVRRKTQEVILELDKRKRAEELIRQSETKLRMLVSNISDVVAIVDKDGIIKYKSPNIKKQFGWKPEDLIGKHALQTTHPDDKKRIGHQLIDLIKTKQKRITVEYKYLCKGGNVKPIELTAVNMLNNPAINGVLVNYKNISDRRHSEDILKQSEEKYRTMIERSNDMIWALDCDGNFTFSNEHTKKITGINFAEWIGKSYKPMVMDEDLSMVDNVFQRSLKGESVQYELRLKRFDDRILTISVNTAPILKNGKINGIVSFGRDITEQRALESQLQQVQKMEAIGSLAGGIAHDFNNILSAIIGYSQLAKFDIVDSEKTAKHIDQVITAAQRAAELTRQILTFSRQSEYHKKPFEIYLDVNEVLQLLRSTIPSNIEIKKEIDSKKIVLADPTKIHQVLMNLCTNAYHAMKKTGGVLTVSLSDIEFSKPNYLKNQKIPLGEYVKLEVHDTGHGMDEKTLKRAFDPYFTTKKIGQGTGLGLALVQAIVDEHDGFLDVHSKPGNGTKFKLYFPIFKGKYEIKNGRPEKESELSGNESIMFVDDEKSIRSVSEKFLKKFGYTVCVFENGIKALEEFRADTNKFDLIITDMTMPELTGDKLAVEILKIRPEMPIILCTGFSDSISESKSIELGIREFVRKPIQSKDLISLIRKNFDKKLTG